MCEKKSIEEMVLEEKSPEEKRMEEKDIEEKGVEKRFMEKEDEKTQEETDGAQSRHGGSSAMERREAMRQMNRSRIPYSVFGVASAVYALFYTFCLYKNASGITYPFFIAGTLCYLFFCMKRYRVPSGSSADAADGRGAGENDASAAAIVSQNLSYDKRKKAEMIFYMCSLLLLGVSVCMTDDWKVLWLTKTGIFLLTVSLALQCFYRTAQWSFSGWLGAICRSLLEMLHYIDTPFMDAIAYFKERGQSAKNRNVGYVLLGIVIAVPLLIVVLMLLLSADAVFSDLVIRMLGDLNLRSMVLICLMAAAVYLLSYSFIRGLTTWQMPEYGAKEKKGEPVAAITFTSLLALLYLIFCGIQVVYLFLGNMRLPEGLTWASYARQGFFQLLFVCLINLALVLVCLAVFRESKALKALLAAISVMTYILIASSAYRMALYIAHYYMTFLRLFVLWALAVIGILFAGVIISIYREKFPLFFYSMAVLSVCWICFAYAKPDYQVARYDIAHLAVEEAGNELESGGREGFHDYWYLTELSADAAPLLAQEDVRRLLAEKGAVQHYYDKVWKRTEKMGLRDFNFSRWIAGKSLEGWYVDTADEKGKESAEVLWSR